MKIFRDLTIQANAAEMASVVTVLEQSLSGGWRRDLAAETRSQSALIAKRRPAYCFSCDAREDRPAAMLVLAQKDDSTFFVSNIIPIDHYQLERDEYNRVLEDFVESIFKPCADRVHLDYELLSPDADLERWMNKSTADLLRGFSKSAHKGTGAAHPVDRERWNAFVLAAHRQGCQLDPSTLARWLVEAENWAPDVAQQLAIEYESGREVLAYASSH